MNICLEIDGVLYKSWEEAVYQEYSELRGYEGTFKKFWEEFDSMSDDEKSNCRQTPLYYNKFIPYKPIIDMLIELAKDNEISYITSRDRSLYDVTVRYLARNKFPNPEFVYHSDDFSYTTRVNEIDYLLVSNDQELVDRINKSFTAVAVSITVENKTLDVLERIYASIGK